jgi:hypothetical protein
METNIASLAPRVIGVFLTALMLRTLLLGFLMFDVGMLLLASVAKALAWFLAFETVRHTWTLLCAMILIFSGSPTFLDCSSRHQNLCRLRRAQPIYTII